MTYLLDSDTCIAVVNGNPQCVRARLFACSPREIGVSMIVYYELLFGVLHSARKEENQANLNWFLRFVTVLEWGAEQATAAAQIREELSRKGQPIGPCDTLIAGHARSLGTVLVTHNTSEFSRVAGLDIEDWYTM